MNLIALDLGTKLGWATTNGSGMIRGGMENFAPRSMDGPGQRWLKFSRFLMGLRQDLGKVDVVYFEEVMAHGTKACPNTIAAHVYGGFLAQLQVFCDVNCIRLVPVGVGQVKKHWTGKGNARKDDMIAEAKRRGFNVSDDNFADALAILHLAMEREGMEQETPV